MHYRCDTIVFHTTADESTPTHDDGTFPMDNNPVYDSPQLTNRSVIPTETNPAYDVKIYL